MVIVYRTRLSTGHVNYPPWLAAVDTVPCACMRLRVVVGEAARDWGMDYLVSPLLSPIPTPLPYLTTRMHCSSLWPLASTGFLVGTWYFVLLFDRWAGGPRNRYSNREPVTNIHKILTEGKKKEKEGQAYSAR